MCSNVRVLEDLAQGSFRLTRHALERMVERSITKADLQSLGLTGIAIFTDGKIKVSGFELDGEKLTAVCVYEDGTLIITVF